MYIFYSVLIYMANFSFLKFRMQVKKSNFIFYLYHKVALIVVKIYFHSFFKFNLILVHIFCCVQLHFCSKCVAHVRVHLYIVNLIVLSSFYLFICFCIRSSTVWIHDSALYVFLFFCFLCFSSWRRKGFNIMSICLLNIRSSYELPI